MLYGLKRHHPIHLSGIVKEDNLAVSTKMPVVAFVLVTPMRTTSGEHIDVDFAAGHLVSVNLIFGLPYLQSMGAIVNLNDSAVMMSKVGHTQFPIKYHVLQYSIPPIASSKWQHARGTPYQGICADLNRTKAQVESVSTATIPGATTEGSSGVRPTKVLKIDIQDAFLKFPMGLPPGPSDHLVAMDTFQQEHSIWSSAFH
jgi:hypothetical protein